MRSLQTVLVNDFGLDLTGWTLILAQAVDDDGLGMSDSISIVGYGTNPDGDQEAWLARIGEFPTTSVPLLPAVGQGLLVGLLLAVSLSVVRRARRG